MREARPQHAREEAVAVLAQRLRVQRGQAPVLTLGRVGVRRRSHVRAEREGPLLHPGVGGRARGAEREIGVEADPAARLARCACGFRELAVELELEPAPEVHLALVPAPQLGDGRRARIAVRLGPFPPGAWRAARRAPPDAGTATPRSRSRRAPALAATVVGVGLRARAARRGARAEAGVERAQQREQASAARASWSMQAARCSAARRTRSAGSSSSRRASSQSASSGTASGSRYRRLR